MSALSPPHRLEVPRVAFLRFDPPIDPAPIDRPPIVPDPGDPAPIVPDPGDPAPIVPDPVIPGPVDPLGDPRPIDPSATGSRR